MRQIKNQALAKWMIFEGHIPSISMRRARANTATINEMTPI